MEKYYKNILMMVDNFINNLLEQNLWSVISIYFNIFFCKITTYHNTISI